MDRGTGAEAVRAAGDCERLAAYLVRHQLTMHLKTKYSDDFPQVESVRIRPLLGVDPSSWPMVSVTGLPCGVPRHLVRAYALLRWSVHEHDLDQKELDVANEIIHEAELSIHAEAGLKHALSGQKGRKQQKKVKESNYAVIVAAYNRLKLARPGALDKALVADTMSETSTKERTVRRALKWAREET